jgi:hypothetical protein
MPEPILEAKCKVHAGRNFLLKFTASALSGGKIRFYPTYIEFDLLTTKKQLKYKDLDTVQNKDFFFKFNHHGQTSKYLSINCLPRDKDKILKILKSKKIKKTK